MLQLHTSQDLLSRAAAKHLAAAQDGIEADGCIRRLPEAANIEGLL